MTENFINELDNTWRNIYTWHTILDVIVIFSAAIYILNYLLHLS